MKRVLLFGALLFCALAPSLAQARDPWRSVQTKNFLLVGNASEGDIRKTGSKLEQFRLAITALLPRLKMDGGVPTKVVVLRDDAAFNDFKPQYKGKTRQNVGGYFLTRPEVNYIVITADDRFDTFAIIFHEYWHFLLHNNLDNVPAWLDEGMAELYSTFYSLDGEKASIAQPIAHHIATLREKPLMPLRTLLAVDRKSREYNESSKAGIFYAESWALVHYLMMSDKQKRVAQLAEFIDRAGSEESLEKKFQQVFQTDYQKMESSLREYVGKATFPVLQISFRDKLTPEKDFVSGKLSEAETEFYMGELGVNVARWEDAGSHYAKAIAADGSFGPAHVASGQLHRIQGRPAEARKAFQTAVAVAPQNYLGHYYLAQFLAAEGAVDEAIATYERAIELQPSSSPVHHSLAALYDRLGRDEKAVQEYSRTVLIDPHNSNAYRSMGYALSRVGRGAPAAQAAKSALRIKGWQDDSVAYMVLAIYFGYRQSNQPIPQASLLDEAKRRLDATAWPAPVFSYLRGEIKADELLALATDNDKLTEARGYLGWDLALKGEPAAARQHFQWVVENGNKSFVEYRQAIAELKRMDANTAKAAAQ